MSMPVGGEGMWLSGISFGGEGVGLTMVRREWEWAMYQLNGKE